ncbi:MAG: hypothetical protein NC338_09055 [Firmicutes bacterium]|nr:hypothetical protein [Bacillota bacterium]MCM1401855.1 hypothetical protein [Bacteroides sp.]MCM1477832.1 hypothetical protein [Bacteroides sp.]
MKKLVYAAIIAIIATMVACKPTEANYRSAYESAKQKQLTGDSLIDQGLIDQQRPKPLIVGADTLPVRTEYIGYTKGGGADSDRSVVKRYCVVVGKFKQTFNARSMRQRLIDQGYDNALVLHNSLKDYYVIANTTPNAHTARLMLDSVLADTTLRLKAPYPYILRPGHLVR